MIAKIKCSNCGAEMSNLSMSWGRKQLWLIIPIMIVGFFPLFKMMFFKGDVKKDLVVSGIQIRKAGSSMEIIGLITNNSRREWSGVTVEAEFYDSSGAFIDEENEYLRAEISAHSQEHFKITVKSPPEQLANASARTVVKISGGHTSPF